MVQFQVYSQFFLMQYHSHILSSNDFFSFYFDWLLFLTDKGLTKFINDLLITPQPEYEIVKKIFEKTYPSDKNYKFTKSQINYDAHIALCNYFEKNLEEIEKWFNIITLGGLTIDNLKDQIRILHGKDWGKIH